MRIAGRTFGDLSILDLKAVWSQAMGPMCFATPSTGSSMR